MARNEAADRHAEESREEDCIGEKCQKQDLSRKPPDAGQLEKQQEQADRKQIHARAGCTPPGPPSPR